MDDREIANAILVSIHARGADKTVCPSEVARALAEDWRSLMPDVRRVAQGLVDQGQIAITQKGRSVNALQARGPIRLGVPKS